MNRQNWILLLAVLMAACAPAENAFIPQTATPETAPMPTTTSNLNEILDEKGSWMRLIPAGDFTMGSNHGLADERPVHTVYLDAYYIDKYEVANVFYRFCVKEGVCDLPRKPGSFSRTDYYGNPDFNLYPVLYVDYNMAKTYCEWRGAKLPTEAQWEKAARGSTERTYPWGEEIGEPFANYASTMGDTTRIYSYEIGKSPYGIYDMAGNVWEWVEDWYSESYYQESPSSNPSGPRTGSHRIVRGGSWQELGGFLRASFRAKVFPTVAYYNTGFRCAKNFTP